MQIIDGLKAWPVLTAFGLAACGEDSEAGTGSLRVLLEAEETIAGGLDPGDEGESIQDGWQVRYSRFIIAIGEVDIHFATDEHIEAEARDVFAVDLVSLPESGLPLWNLEGLRAGRWQFYYSIAGAADATTRHDSVEVADFDQMKDNDWTYLIEGSLTKADGRSCPPASLATGAGVAPAGAANVGGDPCYSNTEIAFSFGLSADTVFGPCEIDGVPGVSIASGGSQTVAATIHGDHLFFNGFPEGDEGGVTRLAQWLADSDLDVDGEVTEQELETIAPSDLAELDSRYQLGGSPINPIDNMWTYVRSQMKTQGHMDGEGECPPDGMPED